jgi:hypothetical protein
VTCGVVVVEWREEDAPQVSPTPKAKASAENGTLILPHVAVGEFETRGPSSRQYSRRITDQTTRVVYSGLTINQFTLLVD